MTTPYKWTVPPELIEHARRLAQQQQRRLPDVVAEALERGLPLVEAIGGPGELGRELGAFQQMYPMLSDQFAGEYVAVFNEALVDHDGSFAALLERINQNYPDDLVLIRLVGTEAEIVYEHRAVHWE